MEKLISWRYTETRPIIEFVMLQRRIFVQHALALGASCLGGGIVGGCSTYRPPAQAPHPKPAASTLKKYTPPPDIFDASSLDLDFWLKPRTLFVHRPATGEKSTVLYWKDGQIQDSAYQELCHLLRDVNGKAVMPMDPKLLEVLWGTQAFVARFGIVSPLEILSGYRTAATNRRLQEQGIPAARKSLHIEGKAADIRIPNLDQNVLGNLVRSFRQGGVGFYFRPSSAGGWIHADTGLQRTWKG